MFKPWFGTHIATKQAQTTLSIISWCSSSSIARISTRGGDESWVSHCFPIRAPLPPPPTSSMLSTACLLPASHLTEIWRWPVRPVPGHRGHIRRRLLARLRPLSRSTATRASPRRRAGSWPSWVEMAGLPAPAGWHWCFITPQRRPPPMIWTAWCLR